MPKSFTVPQFIDVESKIIGAMTIRQFLISLSGLILMFICYKIFTFLIFVICSVFIFIIFGAFAFIKINGRPFHFFVLNFIQTSKKPSLRVWNHRNPMKDQEETEPETTAKKQKEPPKKPGLSSSRLNELSLVVDTQGVYRGEDTGSKKGSDKDNKNSQQ